MTLCIQEDASLSSCFVDICTEITRDVVKAATDSNICNRDHCIDLCVLNQRKYKILTFN